MQVRGLAVFVGAHTLTCCVRPGLTTAIRVELMARQVPSSARNEQVKFLKLFSGHSQTYQYTIATPTAYLHYWYYALMALYAIYPCQ